MSHYNCPMCPITQKKIEKNMYVPFGTKFRHYGCPMSRMKLSQQHHIQAIHNTLKPKHDNDYNNWNTSYSLKLSYIIFILEWFPVEWRDNFLKMYNIDQECLFLQVSKLWKSAFAKFTNFQYFRVPMALKKIPSHDIDMKDIISMRFSALSFYGI